MKQKPVIPADSIDTDANIFEIVAVVRQALRLEKMHTEAKEVLRRVLLAESYDEAKAICLSYVDIV